MAALLAQQSCEPCSHARDALSTSDIDRHLSDLAGGWKITDQAATSSTQVKEGQASAPALEKVFRFKNFRTAIAFANAVGVEAEKEGHHPKLVVEWGSVGVSWWTHSVGGLHKNDFVMAARTDQISETADGLKKAKP